MNRLLVLCEKTSQNAPGAEWSLPTLRDKMRGHYLSIPFPLQALMLPTSTVCAFFPNSFPIPGHPSTSDLVDYWTVRVI